MMCSKYSELNENTGPKKTSIITLGKHEAYSLAKSPYTDKSNISSPIKSLNKPSIDKSPTSSTRKKDKEPDELKFLIDNKNEFLDPIEMEQFTN